jgi:MGT family glycosyltransferase
MAKMVVMNIPGHGHVNPTLAVGAELKRRGTEVIYYNTEAFRPQIEAAGAEFRPYPPSVLSSLDAAQLATGSLIKVTLLLFQASEQLIPWMLDELRREQPDFVMYDSVCLWGMLCARMLNLPSVASITTFILEGMERMMSWREIVLMTKALIAHLPALIRTRSRLVKRLAAESQHTPQTVGLPSPVFPCTGDLNLVFTSRRLQPETWFVNDTFEFVGPSIDSTTRAGDFPFEQLERKPVIYISLGTINNTSSDFYRRCFEAFADHPGQFILSVGEKTDIAQLGTIPNNFVVRNSVPQLKVLEQADAFITHAGMNSLQEALYYGVPLVMVPQQMEQLLNAKVIERQGAGVILGNSFSFGQATAQQLRAALDTVLNNASFRQVAQENSRALQTSGGYLKAVDAILNRMSHKLQAA